MSHLTGFNNLFDKYLSKLIEWNPELTDLQTLKTGAELVRKYNPRSILIQFMQLVGPYYVHILQENEEFLTDLNNLKKHSAFQESNETDQSFALDRMMVFTTKWVTYNEDRKSRFWKLTKALLKIGALASNDPNDKQIIEYIKANPNVF